MTITLEQLREKYNKITGGSNGENQDFLKKFLQIPTGSIYVRILPSTDDNKPFFAETKIHRIKQANGQFKNVHCRKVHGEECPLCELYYGLWKTHESLGLDKDDPSKFRDLARMIKPTPRYYLNVLERENNEVKILSVGGKLFEKILGSVIELQQEDVGDMLDLLTGFDYKIEKVMVDKYPSYDKSSCRPKSTPLADYQMEIDRILAQRHDIHNLVKIESYETVKQIADSLMAGLSSSIDNMGSNSSSSSEDDDSPAYLKKMQG